MAKPGAATFWLHHEHKDWGSNSDGYRFAPVSGEGVTVAVTKLPDKTMEVTVTGASPNPLRFVHPVPTLEQVPGMKRNGVFVAVFWDSTKVVLYLNKTHAGQVDLTAH